MFVVMGATGHVGSAVSRTLLAQGQKVFAITRNAANAASVKGQGAEIIEADVLDVASLRTAFQQGQRAFLLNPPADTSQDTDEVERETVRCILAAIEHSGLERIVAQSTGGAQPGHGPGDLNVLYEFEEGLSAQPIPAVILRGGYYMSNWAIQLHEVRKTGELASMIPADMKIPMVSPNDLGKIAAGLLVDDTTSLTKILSVEGPQRYSPRDVADCLSRALGRDIKVSVTPRDSFIDAFREMGFSKPAAESYARMTETSIDGGFRLDGDLVRGRVTLQHYIDALVREN